MPGGVNSPVRAFKSVGGQPIVIDSILYPVVVLLLSDSAIDLILSNGHLHYAYGPFPMRIVPSIEMIRSVNSGTEACMGALRLARAFTGKQKIIKFEGCSHAMLILFLLRQGEIAALILEPAVGNSGFIVPKLEFLDTIRKIIKENNALLIFDEVMTGFQLSYGGAQEYFGIVPDLKTLGNIIVSGLPVGAYGEISVEGFKPVTSPPSLLPSPFSLHPYSTTESTLYLHQADTLSGNPLAMAAGIEAQKLIKEAGTYEYLDEVTGELVQGILQVGKRSGHSLCDGI
ncbi:Glutamate-1-semialdehyde 2,1-aminomutase, chloroplastic [Glycine soja]|nr:Glutamate-1-semialdehyde 2,1-aminomutase, chloroplastic [Glycine soja]